MVLWLPKSQVFSKGDRYSVSYGMVSSVIVAGRTSSSKSIRSSTLNNKNSDCPYEFLVCG